MRAMNMRLRALTLRLIEAFDRLLSYCARESLDLVGGDLIGLEPHEIDVQPLDRAVEKFPSAYACTETARCARMPWLNPLETLCLSRVQEASRSYHRKK